MHVISVIKTIRLLTVHPNINRTRATSVFLISLLRIMISLATHQLNQPVRPLIAVKSATIYIHDSQVLTFYQFYQFLIIQRVVGITSRFLIGLSFKNSYGPHRHISVNFKLMHRIYCGWVLAWKHVL